MGLEAPCPQGTSLGTSGGGRGGGGGMMAAVFTQICSCADTDLIFP